MYILSNIRALYIYKHYTISFIQGFKKKANPVEHILEHSKELVYSAPMVCFENKQQQWIITCFSFLPDSDLPHQAFLKLFWPFSTW